MERINADTGLGLGALNAEDYAWETLPNPFLGSSNRKLYGLWANDDAVELPYLKEDIPFTRKDMGEDVEATLFALPETAGVDVTYSVYMGGDIAETVIDTGREELPTLLLYGDSFSNPLECLLWRDFNVTYCVDFRYETEKTLDDYLEEYRGVRCTAEQVVVGAGMEYLLSLLAPLLPGKTAVENPGYQRAKQVLENNGVACCCLPVDADGLSVEALSGSGAAVCYVTPSHQFPTGVTMPAGRRTELLHWASRCPGQRYIIEDDYDSEFRFDTRPLPSLQGMAGADYLSTCSRSLAPGIRIAYMVLPRQLLPAWRAKYRIYSGTVSRFEQQTLARFIREGYFTRHLARERVAYKARRDALAASLRAAFAPDELTLTGLHTGLHLLARLKNAPPDAALHAAAKAQGVALSLLSDYDLTGGEQDFSGTFVLGYGSLSEASFPEAGETLRKVCTAAREASVTV